MNKESLKANKRKSCENFEKKIKVEDFFDKNVKILKIQNDYERDFIIRVLTVLDRQPALIKVMQQEGIFSVEAYPEIRNICGFDNFGGMWTKPSIMQAVIANGKIQVYEVKDIDFSAIAHLLKPNVKFSEKVIAEGK